jgi:hypothetical protein
MVAVVFLFPAAFSPLVFRSELPKASARRKSPVCLPRCFVYQRVFAILTTENKQGSTKAT